METVILSDIGETDWCQLRDQLIGNGWTVRRGGGLDHSWAEFRKADVQILMECDRWDGGTIEFATAMQSDVLTELPGDFRQRYAKC